MVSPQVVSDGRWHQNRSHKKQVLPKVHQVKLLRSRFLEVLIKGLEGPIVFLSKQRRSLVQMPALKLLTPTKKSGKNGLRNDQIRRLSGQGGWRTRASLKSIGLPPLWEAMFKATSGPDSRPKLQPVRQTDRQTDFCPLLGRRPAVRRRP